MSRAHKSPYEKPSDSSSASESESESDSGSDPEEVSSIPPPLRKIPEAFNKRYGGRTRRSMMFLQSYQYGWDEPFKTSKIKEMSVFLEGKGVLPVPAPPQSEKQRLHTERLRQYSRRLKETKTDRSSTRKKPKIPNEVTLNKQMAKLAHRLHKVSQYLPQKHPELEALTQKRRALFKEVAEEVTEAPAAAPEEVTIPEPEVFKKKPNPRRKPRRPRRVIDWEATPSEAPSEAAASIAPTEATSIDCADDMEMLRKYASLQ